MALFRQRGSVRSVFSQFPRYILVEFEFFHSPFDQPFDSRSGGKGSARGLTVEEHTHLDLLTAVTDQATAAANVKLFA